MEEKIVLNIVLLEIWNIVSWGDKIGVLGDVSALVEFLETCLQILLGICLPVEKFLLAIGKKHFFPIRKSI